MVSHEIDYKIFGDDIQFVEIELDPNETVIAEAGTMVYMEDGISFEVKMGMDPPPTRDYLEKYFLPVPESLPESLFSLLTLLTMATRREK